jgi:hypothetical protein
MELDCAGSNSWHALVYDDEDSEIRHLGGTFYASFQDTIDAVREQIDEAIERRAWAIEEVGRERHREPLRLNIADLCSRIHRAAELHPEGPSLAALVEEVGEVARAMQDDPARLAEELLDVAVVALRWHMQEVVR